MSRLNVLVINYSGTFFRIKAVKDLYDRGASMRDAIYAVGASAPHYPVPAVVTWWEPVREHGTDRYYLVLFERGRFDS